MSIYTVNSTEKTEALGRAVGVRALALGRVPQFFALYGEMGVGKTAFTRGFASAIAEGAAVRSPTYTVVNEYRGGRFPIFHFDMYRIEELDDLYSIGFEDYFKKDGFLIAEWCERIEGEVPPDAVRITITRGEGEEERIIRIEGDGYEHLIA